METLRGAPHVNLASLREHGFTEEALQKLEKALPTSFAISFAFNRWTLGDDFCKDALGFTEEQLSAPDFDMLTGLGFSKEAIEAANLFVVPLEVAGTWRFHPRWSWSLQLVHTTIGVRGDYEAAIRLYEAEIKELPKISLKDDEAVAEWHALVVATTDASTTGWFDHAA